MPPSRRKRPRQVALVLSVFFVLFAGRVAGQWFVESGAAPWLPARSEWYSGMIPYRPLLAVQLALLVLLAMVIRDFARGRGYFVEPRPWFAVQLWWFGLLYMAAMLVRYGLLMLLRPDLRWLHGTIPILFHIVLAGFLLTVSHYHRASRTAGRLAP